MDFFYPLDMLRIVYQKIKNNFLNDAEIQSCRWDPVGHTQCVQDLGGNDYHISVVDLTFV